MSTPVSWGILSTAKIGVQKVVPALQKSPRLAVAAIASRDGARAAAVARTLGIPRAYGSYEELLADPGIEAIYNPLPNHLHVPWTLRALAAGKHVLCEKPLALDAAEARTLLAARERSGRLVAEAFMVRYHPQWRRTRELLRAGAIGEARAITTEFAYFLRDPANVRNQAGIGGGGLMDIGCYAVATARYLFAAEPLRAAAVIDRDPDFGVDRLTSGLLEFPEGRRLAFTCATQLGARQRVSVLGTQGRIEVMVPFNPSPDRSSRIVIDDGRDLEGGGAREEMFPACDQYTLQGEGFAAAIRGEAPLEHEIEDAVANMAAIDALFRAAASGRWEAV